MKYVAKKIEAGEYEYRNYTIYRRKQISAGYYGAWRINMYYFDSLSAAKMWVDDRIASRKEEN